MGAALCGEFIFELSMTAESRWEILPVLSMGCMFCEEVFSDAVVSAAERVALIFEGSISAALRTELISETLLSAAKSEAFMADVPVFAAGCREVICAA